MEARYFITIHKVTLRANKFTLKKFNATKLRKMSEKNKMVKLAFWIKDTEFTKLEAFMQTNNGIQITKINK